MHGIYSFLRKTRNVENCSVAFQKLQISYMYSRLNHHLQCRNSYFCHRPCNSSLSRHCTHQFTYGAFLATAAELDHIAPPKPAAAAIDIFDILVHFCHFWLVPAVSSWPVDASICADSPVPCLRVHRVLHAPPPATHM